GFNRRFSPLHLPFASTIQYNLGLFYCMLRRHLPRSPLAALWTESVVVSAVNTIPISGCSPVAMRTSSGSERGFVAGPENRLIAEIADRLIHSQDVVPSGIHAIALIGPSGSGKTHLARGIADLWSQRSEKSNAIYVTALDFRRRLDHA